MSETRQSPATVTVERLTQYAGTDLDDLCEATESAIVEGGGFGWLKPPPRQVLENLLEGRAAGAGAPARSSAGSTA